MAVKGQTAAPFNGEELRHSRHEIQNQWQEIQKSTAQNSK